MNTAVEQGRQPEQRVASFFEGHGYGVACNQILEGRSGRSPRDRRAGGEVQSARHLPGRGRVDPIEKDVAAKLRYIVGDLALSKGIIVSLSGCRSGAERTAPDLGIDL